MNGENRVLDIMLATEGILDLTGLDLRGERVEGGLEIVFDRLALADPVDQNSEIIRLPPQ